MGCSSRQRPREKGMGQRHGGERQERVLLYDWIFRLKKIRLHVYPVTAG